MSVAPQDADIRRDERALIREWIYGRQIDILWQGRMPPADPRPMGAARLARTRGLDDVLAILDQRDAEVRQREEREAP